MSLFLFLAHSISPLWAHVNSLCNILAAVKFITCCILIPFHCVPMTRLSTRQGLCLLCVLHVRDYTQNRYSAKIHWLDQGSDNHHLENATARMQSTRTCITPDSSLQGLSSGASCKEFTCQCRRLGFDPWVRKIPWRRAWQPTPVFLPGKSQGQRSLAGHSP